jgi:hypothetical protein
MTTDPWDQNSLCGYGPAFYVRFEKISIIANAEDRVIDFSSLNGNKLSGSMSRNDEELMMFRRWRRGNVTVRRSYRVWG